MPLTFDTLRRETTAVQIPEAHNPELLRLTRPHVDSFNSMFEGGLDAAIAALDAKDVIDQNGNRLQYAIEQITVGKPMLSDHETASKERYIFPSECRERRSSYRARMQIKIQYSVNDGPLQTETKSIGLLPIMVRSLRCNLHDATPRTLVEKHEDAEDMGGYFVVNGLEKLIRLLIVNRRNYVLGISRPSFTRRGPLYTSFGTQIRCVRPDQSAQTVTVHHLSDGDCTVRFSFRKREYMIPAVIVFKALQQTSDKAIFDRVVQGAHANTFVTERVEAMLRKQKKFALFSQRQCLAFLGAKFQPVLGLSETYTDVMVGEELLRRVLFVHLTREAEKFDLLVYMVQKLLALVAGDCVPDNPDSPMNHEILLPGHLIQMFLKEKLDEYLGNIRLYLQSEMRRGKQFDFLDTSTFRKALVKVPADLGKKVEYFLSTGNLVTQSGLDLQQASGYCIIAEKLNYLRYLSHFRSVHRGAFFAELRTTTVRKLLPESWGFLCPVHTPDGAPCGLLNHLASLCHITTEAPDARALPGILVSLGLTPMMPGACNVPPDHLTVFLDGRILGKAAPALVATLADKLRFLKIRRAEGVPWELEIGLVRPSQGGQYPGLFLWTTPARMMRPVRHLATGADELIGCFEQVYLDVAVQPSEVVPGVSTHVETAPTNMLSVVANTIPFCDFNQSPRNMYTCQMGKQSMASPAHNLPHRTDNKMYRIMTPQTPIVRPANYSRYSMDNYPIGCNAVVAVISYTGYDMEDAMILNKFAFERGFGNGTVYQNKWADLTVHRKKGEPVLHRFGNKDRRLAQGKLDADGLPFVGSRLEEGDPLYCYIDETTGQPHIEKYKSTEVAYVEEVRVLGDDAGQSELQLVNIKLRIPRPPVIGDKFSSRHGQKGVCSQKYPMVDLPFTESGMSPDVIINPHAFPSRMTIGMLIESMAGKSGALHGLSQDATPFRFSERHTALDFFGEQLAAAGYNYYGNEPMYSGITGLPLRADIYIGVVYYLRLRHMVSDKFQVRTTGPVHNLTQQPVKGRKRAGGIRLGEMERDSLLGHGTAFLLHDRLMNCSDYSHTHCCRLCGSIVSPITTSTTGVTSKKVVTCRACETSKGIELIAVPYVFRYLASELLSMNIRLNLTIK